MSIIKISRGERIFGWANIGIMLALLVFTLYPMLYVLFASFSDPQKFAAYHGLLYKPVGFTLDAYKNVFKMQNIQTGFRNTLFYVVAGTTINMVLTILGAYATSRKDFLLRRPLMIFMLVTMFFGGGMIPTFLIVQKLGLTNTVWGVLIPGCISTYNLIILRTGFEAIPVSLFEAADIDGANQFSMLIHIVLPLSTASLATIGLFYAVGRWGDWYSALVYLQQRRDLYPLQMFLREMLIKGDMTDPAIVASLGKQGSQQYLLNQIIKYAAIVVTTIPILVIYPSLQKYFVKGVMVGAVKE